MLSSPPNLRPNPYALLVTMVVFFSSVLAAPVTLIPMGSYDNLLLMGSSMIRFQANAKENTVLMLEGTLAEGTSLPEGIESQQTEKGLLIKFSEPYQLSRSADERRVQAIRVRHLQATNPMRAVGSPIQSDPRAPLIIPLSNTVPSQVAGQLQALYNNLKIVVDDRQRSLMIIVNPEDKPLIEAIVKYLDTPRPQVSFEAEVLEINRSATQNLGIDYEFMFKLGIKENNIPTPSGAQPFRFGSFGRDTSNGIGISATINLLQANGAGRILARPRIVTLDGLEARINATQNTPLVVSNNNQTTVQNVATGITLSMLPKVAPDGTVEVRVSISVSAPTGVTSAGVPTFSNREATTTVRVENGEPIVIGGLLESRLIEGQNKVPGLGDIPVLGELFKNTTTNTAETDLVIIITPRLLTNITQRSEPSLGGGGTSSGSLGSSSNAVPSAPTSSQVPSVPTQTAPQQP